MTGTGAISDPNGISISPVGASSPAVAANGNGYLVVWVDGRNATTNGLDIFGARVNGAGAVLFTLITMISFFFSVLRFI